ncbi:cardiolipin synthase [Desulfosarcina sp. OttesenSCG-928-G10]|nr:cardiolipin synthase [Desulfosarcina sp. OttesenSCG-928-G10]MDL2320894.1 cardiolipin synthase [Desulfosarcina sp. OttesenSCG-928-B08]
MPFIEWVNEYWVVVIPLVFHTAGLVFIFDVIMNGRTSQGTIAWVMALFFCPYLAVIFYLVFGARRIKNYSIAHQSGVTDIHHLGKMLQQDERLQALMDKKDLSRIDIFSHVYHFPVMKGNRATLLVDGEETFASLFEGIASARHYILAQFFIIHPDNLGNRFKAALIERAKAGVQVYFLYDQIGSVHLSRAYIRELKAAGVHVSIFKVGGRWVNRLHINFRNHRKIVVVDGEKSWVGGHNVGDDYLGKGKKFRHWRDTHVKVEGPATLPVQLSFVEDWYWVCGKLPDVCWNPPPLYGNEPVLCIPTGPGDLVESCSLMMVQAINTATSRCWMMTPYFVPDVAVIKALQLAAMRGVDVRILIPGNPDKRVVWWAAHSYLAEVAVAGVRMYTYTEGFMHQKVFLIDDRFAGIGTANLDNRSLRINFEITLLFTDPAFIQKVEEMCRTDFSRSTALTTDEIYRSSLFFRLAIRASRLFSPIL